MFSIRHALCAFFGLFLLALTATPRLAQVMEVRTGRVFSGRPHFTRWYRWRSAMPSRLLVRIAAFAVALGVLSSVAPTGPAAQAPPPTRYTIEDVSIPGAGPSWANAISPEGLTVGASEGVRVRALRFDGAARVHLDTLAPLLAGTNHEAHAVSYQYIAGTFIPAGGTAVHGFVFDGTQAVDIGSLGGTDTYALAVDHAGTVAGGSLLSNGRKHAFLRYASGAWQDLGTLGGLESQATSISGSHVTGFANIATGAVRAFLYDGMSMRNLGTLGGTFSAGLAVDGDVVAGHARTANGRLHAFTHDGRTMRDLGTLGGDQSTALGINQWGYVVGESNTTIGGPLFAFLYRDGQMVNLNSLIDPASGWVLLSATGINDAGQIVGYGTYQGAMRAFRLLPPGDIEVYTRSVVSDFDGNLPNPMQTGREMTWVVGVRNITGAPAYVTVIDTISGAVEILSAGTWDGGSPCAVRGNTVTCTAHLFEGGGGEDFVLRVRATAAGVFSHSVSASSAAADPDLSNNAAGPQENTAVSLSAVGVSPTTIAGGKSASLRVWLTSSAPYSGNGVRLTSSNPAVLPVPASLGVPNGGTTRVTNILPKVVATPTPVAITATYGLVTKTTTLTVVPPVLSGFSLSPTTVIGGCGVVSANVTLSGSAPASGGPVSIAESIAAAQFPTSMLVAPGAITKTVSVPTSYVTTSQVGTVTASYGGVSRGIQHTVRAIRARSISMSPNPIVGGAMANGIVTLECTSPSPIVVAFESSNTALATPTLASITIPAGLITGSFAVRTADVTAVRTVSIHARVYGARVSTSLKLNP